MARNSSSRSRRRNNNIMPVVASDHENQITQQQQHREEEEEEENNRFAEIPLYGASFLLWLLMISVSSFVFTLCTLSYLVPKLAPNEGIYNKPFSWPLYDVIDSRIQRAYVMSSLKLLFFPIILSFLVRYLVNRNGFRLPQFWRSVLAFSKLEIDLLFNNGISLYLTKFSGQEDPLIVFSLTALACLLSSWISFLLGPNADCVFQVLATLFTCIISYTLSIYAYHAFYLSVGSQVATFILFLPFAFDGAARRLKQSCALLLCLFLFLLLLLGNSSSAPPTQAPTLK